MKKERKTQTDMNQRKEHAKPFTLDMLNIGESAVIGKIAESCRMKNRLTDLGFCPGEKIV